MSFTGKGLHAKYRHEIRSAKYPANKIMVGEECDSPEHVGMAMESAERDAIPMSLNQEGIIRLIEALHQELILLRERE